jgi:uncharacterized membrane protein YhiD involved in acid resistance
MPEFLQFEDLSGTFTVTDLVLSITLSFVLSSVVGLVYRATHRGVSYSQTYVQTLVLMGMVVSVVMLIVGSNIARAFALVGALSIIRFRNAVKETRDVGFIFLAMAIGMATGTRFYMLATLATGAISAVILLMNRMDWFKLNVQSQVVKVQVPAGEDYSKALDDALLKYTTDSELVSLESVRAGALTEMTYTARLKDSARPGQLIQELRQLTGGQKVTVLTGYDRTDL